MLRPLLLLQSVIDSHVLSIRFWTLEPLPINREVGQNWAQPCQLGRGLGASGVPIVQDLPAPEIVWTPMVKGWRTAAGSSWKKLEAANWKIIYSIFLDRRDIMRHLQTPLRLVCLLFAALNSRPLGDGRSFQQSTCWPSPRHFIAVSALCAATWLTRTCPSQSLKSYDHPKTVATFTSRPHDGLHQFEVYIWTPNDS